MHIIVLFKKQHTFTSIVLPRHCKKMSEKEKELEHSPSKTSDTFQTPQSSPEPLENVVTEQPTAYSVRSFIPLIRV